MSYLTDTHCHLNDEQLYPHADELIARAVLAGVKRMFVVGYDEPSSKTAIELADRYEQVYAIIGIHPTELTDDFEARLQTIEQLAQHPKVIAIGETGLDHYWNKTEHEHVRQAQAFNAHIELANRRKLPIVVHSRDAIQDTLEVMKRNQPRYGGVMHCYSGPGELVGAFVELGMYISLGGPVTFTNARVPKEVASIVPNDRLLVETDSPYLAPHPNRGKRNEPALLPLVAKTIAAIRNESYESICELTSANAERLFHVKHL